MNPSGEGINRSAIRIVGGVVDELIIEGEFCHGGQRIAVIGLDELLQARMRQLPIADKNASPSEIEKLLVDTGNTVDHTGNSNPVVRPAPLLSGKRDACLDRAVDVGKIPWLDCAVGPAGASKHAEVCRDLLLDVDAHAGPVMVLANRVDVGWLAGGYGEIDGILEQACPAFADEAGDLDLARLLPQLVSFLDLPDVLELLEG